MANNDGRKLVFSGGNADTISGTGTLNIYELEVNKSANNLTLNRNITVDTLFYRPTLPVHHIS